MKKWIAYLLIILLLGMAVACQVRQGEELQVDPGQIIEGEYKQEQVIKNPTHIAEFNPDALEQAVIIGVEGFKEEVRFKQFSNPWLVMWVDPRLEVEESEDIVLFSREQEGLQFSVKRVLATEIEREHELLDEELTANGYVSIEQFTLDDIEGSGCIYYSHEEQQSIDHYLLDIDEEHAFLVQFTLPERMMEAYTHRFEYMLESISKRDV